MSRVEWSRRTADEIETLIGIMLCRLNPAATRIRPSQGDRGVDVYVPDGDEWTVYQVKSFTGPLTSSHKRQIKKSWVSFTELVQEQSLKIRAWYLIRPENPTWEDEKWLHELTDGAAFPCSWQGLDHCEALAADHQSVVDYYLFNGKERLQGALTDLLAAMHVNAATSPTEAQARLEAVHASINAHDPHYVYDFAVQTVHNDQLPEVNSRGGLVAAVTQASGDRAVTFYVMARYREATSDRPVPGRFTLVTQPGTAEAQAVRDFFEYGIPVVNVRARDLDWDLPGGLGGSQEEGTVTLGAARLDAAQPTELQLVVLDPHDDAELAVADLVMEPATTGLDGRRFAIAGEERYGVFGLLMRVDPVEGKYHMSFEPRELTGKAPADVLPGLNALAALTPPNRFVIRLRHGPALDSPQFVPTTIAQDADRLIRVCEALAVIQRHTVLPIRIPDLTETSVTEAREWIRAARLLNGDTISLTWDRIAFDLHDDAELPSGVTDAVTVATTSALIAKVGDREVDLGLQVAQLAMARVDPSDLGDDGQPVSSSVHMVPAGDNTGTIRWLGKAEDGAPAPPAGGAPAEPAP